MKTKVILIESQKEVSDRITCTLSNASDIELCANYNSTVSGISDINSEYSGVYLIDINCIDFLKHVSKINKKAIFIVSADIPDIKGLVHSLLAGASGYIIKDCNEKELIDSIKNISSGKAMTNLSTANCFFYKFKELIQNKHRLTMTELKVLQQLSNGASYEEIAAQRNVSLSTIQSHVKKIYKKYNVNNKKDAIAKGTLLGIL